ncbi:uncharacterized protein fs(1)M3 [Drosophila virilis]|uniref:VWFD domain-containing protein n=1 Tax=Drosophila virilis TaxID=7244 RepID=B4MEL2_DROVI|nr:uncharacterized protein LOC6636179 [Drosophila virilis]EDW62987.2 uncharacterized protein Dvir_GJ14840 [Drosophila virilis]
MWPHMLSMESLFVLLCVFNFLQCQGQGQGAAPIVGPTRLMPSVCRRDTNGSSLSVEIRLPFMDMELRHERHLHVLRAQQLLLVLHGHELFQLQVAGRDKRLVRLGELTGRVGQQVASAAAVVLWREYLLLAVALPESLEFYQLAQQAMLDANQQHFEPIQEFALAGSLQQLHLLQPNPEQVLLLLTLNVTQSQARCRTYEWLETYFNPVEELTLPSIKAFQVVGRQPYYIITGRTLRGQSKLVLTIYELLTPTLRLLRRQSLTVQARHVLAARFRGRNLLIACAGAGGNSSTSSTCILFRMVDGHFVVYRKHVLRQLQFSHLAAFELGQLLVGARANGQVLVFNSQRLDCYSGFGADPNPSGIYTHRNPQNESFLLLSYRRQPGTTLLRMVQLGGANDATILAANLEGNDDLSSVQQHRHEFEQSINGLRSLLLRRKQQLDAVHQLLGSLEQQPTRSLTQPLHLRNGSRVQLVQLQGSHLASPMQLLRRMERLRQQYGHAVIRRSTRSFGAGNASYTGEQDTLKVKRLHVQNLIYQGQLLPGYHLESSSPPILSIKGQLLTKRLHTEQLLIPPSYKRPERSLDVHTVVRHLQVERINNISWFEFYDSLFLYSRDNEIEGRLVLQARARVVNLQTPLLNGKLVEQLFNLRQPQVVTSNIFMSAFIAPKLDANLVNGLNFAKDIVFRGAKNNLIKTPVRIYQMSVSGDIIVENDSKSQRQMAAEQRPFNLQQYYRGRIILNGSLTVNNLQRDTNETRLQLGGQSLRARDLHVDYLLLQTPQHLDTLAFGNAKVTTRALSTHHINGHPTAEHLLSGAGHEPSQAAHRRLHLIFMNVRIDGNVYCGNYSSRLAQLARNAVRQGETANITGHKIFEAPLHVDTLSSQALNGLPVQELVLKSQLSQNFTDLKFFPRIVVKSQLEIDRNLTAQRLNHMELPQLFQPAYSLQRLELPEMPKLQQLIFRRLNGLAFDELLGKLSAADGEPEQPLLLHKQLIIEGNVRFQRPLQLRTLNAIHWDEYVKGLVSANANSLILGEKRFLEPVLITDALHAPSINGLDLSALLENTLLRTTPQSIGGVYSFARLTASNVDVAELNGMPTSSFLDLGQPSLRLQGDLYVPELQLNGSLSCALLNDPLPRLDSQLAALQQRSWRRLMVLGDALWPEASEPQQQQQQLDYLRLHAVRRRAASQIISGHVILQQPLLSHLQASLILPGGFNISHIAKDALLRRSPVTQLVKAPQTMLQEVQARSIRLLKDGQFELLNGIDLRRLNASLYRRSSGQPMGAHLRFQLPPNITQLRLRGGLNGGHHVANIYEQSPGGIWPAVQLRELQLQQQLQLHEINGMSLEYLLEQRVPLRGAALELFDTLHFERLVLGERPMLRTINGIDLQRVVYKHGQRPQAVGGAKTFARGIEFQGPAHIMRLNGRDLSESYQQSIYTDRDYSIDSLVLDGASFPGGLLADAAMGESRQAPQMELELGHRPLSAREQLRQQLQELEQQLQSNRANHSQRLLYLDYEQLGLELTWSAPAADEILQLVAAQTPQPTGICQLQQLLAQISTRQQRVHLTNVSLASRLLRASSGRAAIRVKAQNYCNQPLQQFRSRMHISCRGHAHTLGLRQHVEALQLHDQEEYSLLLISGTDEVRVLRVNHTNCSLSDWQSVQPSSAGRLMKLLQLEGNRTLLLTGGLQQPEHLPVVAVHRLDAQSQRFELLQHIEGDYDLAELQSDQLLLSCHSCRHISVHVFSPDAEQFVPLQQLRLAARIQQLLPFSVAQERHLLVLTMPDSKHFYLFSYAHIEGWQQRTYGRHMSDFQWSWPLLRSGQELTTSAPILLLCGQRFCSLVKALLD